MTPGAKTLRWRRDVVERVCRCGDAGRLFSVHARPRDDGPSSCPQWRYSDVEAGQPLCAAAIPSVTLHSPRDPAVAAGINCFEVAGLTPEKVVQRLADARFRTTTSPYKVSYARVCAGIMNTPQEIEAVLRAFTRAAMTALPRSVVP